MVGTRLHPAWLALILLGATAGTAARAGLEAAFAPGAGQWPWVTFWINVLGSLALGGLLEGLSGAGPDVGVRLASSGLGTGLLGGLPRTAPSRSRPSCCCGRVTGWRGSPRVGQRPGRAGGGAARRPVGARAKRDAGRPRRGADGDCLYRAGRGRARSSASSSTALGRFGQRLGVPIGTVAINVTGSFLARGAAGGGFRRSAGGGSCWAPAFWAATTFSAKRRGGTPGACRSWLVVAGPPAVCCCSAWRAPTGAGWPPAVRRRRSAFASLPQRRVELGTSLRPNGRSAMPAATYAIDSADGRFARTTYAAQPGRPVHSTSRTSASATPTFTPPAASGAR